MEKRNQASACLLNPRRMPKTLLAGWLILLALLPLASQANSLLFCEQPGQQTVERKGTLLLLAQTVKNLLEQSGHQAAIVSRSGLDLERFQVRFTHAGISLRNSPNTPWSVRQLYYACEEGQPHLYDQGLPGFLIDQHQDNTVRLSIVLLPPAAEARMVRAAQDNKLALALLAPDYSANAYAYSTRYQNCNQWLVELLAHAWGELPDSPAPRAQAQDWLRQQHYQPATVDVHYRFMVWAAHFIPLLHHDDQPAAELALNHYQLSLPSSIEAFVQQQFPDSQRIQLCLRQDKLLIHHGWDEMSSDCKPAANDQLQQLD